jgi:hypothetical protein
VDKCISAERVHFVNTYFRYADQILRKRKAWASKLLSTPRTKVVPPGAKANEFMRKGRSSSITQSSFPVFVSQNFTVRPKCSTPASGFSFGFSS